MTPSKAAAAISTVAALVIVVATFWQWFDVTYEGAMPMRPWVRPLLVVVTLMLAVSLVLLLVGE